MHLSNQLMIDAPAPVILDAAYFVERWPDLLPHYRWVRIVEEGPGGRIIQMAARRGPIPLKWTALQWRDDRALKIYFRHLRGPTRGMDVVWELQPVSEHPARTCVTIGHDLHYPVPVLGPLVAHYIVGALFISPTANRTLRCFKQILEGAGSRRA